MAQKKTTSKYTLKQAKFDIDFAFAKIELLEAQINDLNDIIKQDQDVINALQTSYRDTILESAHLLADSKIFIPKDSFTTISIPHGSNIDIPPYTTPTEFKPQFVVMEEISKKQPTFWQSLFRIKKCK